MREKCQYLEFFRTVFSRMRTQYGEIIRISPRVQTEWGKYKPEKLQIRTLFGNGLMQQDFKSFILLETVLFLSS